MASAEIMEIVFATRGIQAVVADFQRLESQTQRLQQLQQNAYYAPTTSNLNALQNAQLAQQQNGVRMAAQAAMGQAAAAISVLKEEISLVREGIEAYSDFAGQIRTIQAMTGGSTRQAEQFTNLSRIAGMSPQIATREVGNLARTTNTAKGQQALGQLGVSAGGNELDNFNRIVAALSKMQDGAQKTRIEMDLFGARGTQALQPMLQLQSDIIERSNMLNANLDGNAMAAITHLQQNFGLLGQTMETEFVIPIIQKIIPAIDWVVTKIEDLIDGFHAIDEATGGALSWIVVFGGIALAVGTVIAGVMKFIEVMKALQIVQKAEIAIQAVIDAFSGNYAALAAGIAIAGVAGVAIAYNNSQNGDAKDSGKDIKDSAASFKSSVSDFGAAVQQHTKNWSAVAGGQLGSGLRESDYAFLSLQGMQGAIG